MRSDHKNVNAIENLRRSRSENFDKFELLLTLI